MSTKTHYDRTARWLHWAMAAMILAMIFIGVGMVASLEARPWLLALHRPLGLLVLVLAAWRLWHRWRHPAPALPDSVPALQARVARASHVLLYTLMFAMPLLGWAMSSAGGYGVALPGGFVLPALAPQDAALYSWLRCAHGALGYAFFGLILLHLSGALYHAWVRRDGVFESMAHDK
ncbi:cytochrome b [Arenimonas sp.]|uniref:cytochrome b n=1 Tax=Arenimonas sp. TaxID=1872635 RepID=UPI0025BE3035|nr:cytochrome b [Arenimonas sp.]